MKELLQKLLCLLGFHDWWYMPEDDYFKKEAYYYCMRCDKRKK